MTISSPRRYRSPILARSHSMITPLGLGEQPGLRVVLVRAGAVGEGRVYPKRPAHQ
jgi:hypothetical protein